MPMKYRTVRHHISVDKNLLSLCCDRNTSKNLKNSKLRSTGMWLRIVWYKSLSETSVCMYQSTVRYISGDSNPEIHGRVNLKSHHEVKFGFDVQYRLLYDTNQNELSVPALTLFYQNQISVFGDNTCRRTNTTSPHVQSYNNRHYHKSIQNVKQLSQFRRVLPEKLIVA
jgi:hypothetical protein